MKKVLVILVAWAITAASLVQGAVIPTVPVGNPGNAPDVTTGRGSVAYAYRIGKHEVTNEKYCEFLNAVDPNGTDVYDLYNSNMANSYGGITFSSGNAYGEKYAVMANRGNKPVNYVCFWDACRFANWLHNGGEDGDTETGAYTLTPAGIANNTVTRNPGWKWAVASEDEWYKAAYYNSASGTYYDFPTRSNAAPVAEGPPGTNATTGSANYNRSGANLEDVGAYTFKPSDSPYGTFDQGGNVWEWNEMISSSNRGTRGGCYFYDGINEEDNLKRTCRYYQPATFEDSKFGFRVCEVPEPATLSLLVLGGLPFLRRRV